MARIDIPQGPGGELTQLWNLNEKMGAAVTALSATIAETTSLRPREREAARMRIAQINDCSI
jgi:alkylhydroperoxidase family enzyme